MHDELTKEEFAKKVIWCKKLIDSNSEIGTAVGFGKQDLDFLDYILDNVSNWRQEYSYGYIEEDVIPTLTNKVEPDDWMHFNCYGEYTRDHIDTLFPSSENSSPISAVYVNGVAFLYPNGYELTYEEIIENIGIKKAYVEVNMLGGRQEILVDREGIIVQPGMVIRVIESVI